MKQKVDLWVFEKKSKLFRCMLFVELEFCRKHVYKSLIKVKAVPKIVLNTTWILLTHTHIFLPLGSLEESYDLCSCDDEDTG